MEDPYDVALTVHDESTFINFLRVLSADRRDEVRKEMEDPSSPYGPGANDWEHGTIEDYLDAAAAWAEDWNRIAQVGKTPGMKKLTGSPWQKCALILAMGKVYE